MSADPAREKNQERWNGLIGSRIVAWEYSTACLDDGDSIPPTGKSIASALGHALSWRDKNEPAPLDIIPDGDGGILFQVTKTPVSEFSINVLSDGSVDHLLFIEDRLSKREHFPIA